MIHNYILFLQEIFKKILHEYTIKLLTFEIIRDFSIINFNFITIFSN